MESCERRRTLQRVQGVEECDERGRNDPSERQRGEEVIRGVQDRILLLADVQLRWPPNRRKWRRLSRRSASWVV